MQIIEIDVFLCCENCVRKIQKALEEMDGEYLESWSFTIAIEGSLKISLSLSLIIFSPQLKHVCPMYISPCDKHSRADSTGQQILRLMQQPKLLSVVYLSEAFYDPQSLHCVFDQKFSSELHFKHNSC